MKGQDILFSSKSDNWSTPKWLYDVLNKQYNFDDDPCPLRTKEDGLKRNWGKKVFVNPPYSNITKFIEKGIKEIEKGNTELIIYLLPARTDTKWFHNYIYKKREIIFLKGRLKFGNSKNSAPFPSMIVIFK